MSERWNPWTDAEVMPPSVGGSGAALQGSGAYTQNTGTIQFANSNGITFGLSTDIMTASHNGLTTARASNDAIGLNTAGTAITWTVNSSGISINAGAYLTTAQPPGAYLTTARASNDAVGLNTAATQVTWTVNSSGISLNAGAYLTTAQSPGAYLTTARASTDAIGLNTAATAVTWTVNSSGISLNAGAYLTTAANSTHSHGNPTLALTNLTGTTASASNGLTISLSAAAPGGGDAIRGIVIGASTATTNSVNFSNANGVSFGFGAAGNSTVITASHNALVTAAASDHSHGNPTLALTNLSGTTASASNGLTLSLAAAAPGGGNTMSYFNLYEGPVAGTSAINVIGSSSVIVQPFFLPQAMSISYVRIPVSMGHVNSGSATTAARSWTLAQTDCYCVNFYSLGAGGNSRSLQHVAGSSGLFTKHIRYEIGAASNNQSCSVTITGPSEGAQITYTTSFTVNSASFTFHTTGLSNSVAGFKWIDVPFASSLSPGNWWIGIQKQSTTATTTAGGNWAQLTNVTSRASLIGISQINTPILPWGVATNTSTGAAWRIGLGAWTTNSLSTSSSSMALSNILSLANVPLFNIQLVRQA